MDGETIIHLAVVAGVAIVILFTIGRLLWERNWIKKRGIKAEGVVVELVEELTKGDRSNNFTDRITYFPVIRYKIHTWEDKTVKYTIDFGASKFKPGDKVNIIYDRKKVERFVIDG